MHNNILMGVIFWTSWRNFQEFSKTPSWREFLKKWCLTCQFCGWNLRKFWGLFFSEKKFKGISFVKLKVIWIFWWTFFFGPIHFYRDFFCKIEGDFIFWGNLRKSSGSVSFFFLEKTEFFPKISTDFFFSR